MFITWPDMSKRPPVLNFAASQTREAVNATCEVCRDAIKSDDVQYRIGESDYHPACFKLSLTTPLIRPAE